MKRNESIHNAALLLSNLSYHHNDTAKKRLENTLNSNSSDERNHSPSTRRKMSAHWKKRPRPRPDQMPTQGKSYDVCSTKGTIAIDQTEHHAKNLNRNFSNSSRKKTPIGEITQRFIRMCKEHWTNAETGECEIALDVAAFRLGIERRRLYDIVNVLGTLGFVTRKKRHIYHWEGKVFVIKTLAKLQSEAMSHQNQREAASTAPNEWGAKGGRSIFLYGGESSYPQQKKKARSSQSMSILSRSFVQLFLVPGQQTLYIKDVAQSLAVAVPTEESKRVSAAVAGDSLLTPGTLNPPREGTTQKSQYRRLYDIANILVAVKLIKKSTSKNPMFTWIGTDPFALPKLARRIAEYEDSAKKENPEISEDFLFKSCALEEYPCDLPDEQVMMANLEQNLRPCPSSPGFRRCSSAPLPTTNFDEKEKMLKRKTAASVPQSRIPSPAEMANDLDATPALFARKKLCKRFEKGELPVANRMVRSSSDPTKRPLISLPENLAVPAITPNIYNLDKTPDAEVVASLSRVSFRKGKPVPKCPLVTPSPMYPCEGKGLLPRAPLSPKTMLRRQVKRLEKYFLEYQSAYDDWKFKGTWDSPRQPSFGNSTSLSNSPVRVHNEVAKMLNDKIINLDKDAFSPIAVSTPMDMEKKGKQKCTNDKEPDSLAPSVPDTLADKIIDLDKAAFSPISKEIQPPQAIPSLMNMKNKGKQSLIQKPDFLDSFVPDKGFEARGSNAGMDSNRQSITNKHFSPYPTIQPPLLTPTKLKGVMNSTQKWKSPDPRMSSEDTLRRASSYLKYAGKENWRPGFAGFSQKEV